MVKSYYELTVMLTGKPIDEIDFPALTICSQGWAPEVVNSVLEKQFQDYRNKSPDSLKTTPIETLKKAYTKAMYPGSNLPPEKIISQLTSQNPRVTLSSEVLVDKGYDECENLADEASQDLSCPDTPGINWKELEMNKDGSKKMLCINVNHRMAHTDTTSGSPMLEEYCNVDPHMAHCCMLYGQCASPFRQGNTCTGYGANRLSFSLDDSALQEKLFEYYCDGNFYICEILK